ncbi:GNAT family N-acetyltransferase [Novosphingobium sp. 1949]|uniref:GNAT family N-acetyltransferase n=1 Tax=Novosphingobium organovorum TaxID=2930092 RepID=A0ABT0BAP3_9SPHN|nr:N-acetyltransferase [Novosphingobium organovorum]MCJ2182019.1 GNAT family N-acetyltransferase [Novosphingobium organovorum]
MATIRPAARADLDALFALELQTFPEESYGEIALRQFIDLFPGLFFVAEDAGTIAGYGLGGIDQQGQGWVLSLGVSPAYQGQGIGARLFDAVLDALRGTGAIRLTVIPDNVRAVTLYERKGFTTEARVEDYYGPGQHRLVMVRLTPDEPR